MHECVCKLIGQFHYPFLGGGGSITTVLFLDFVLRAALAPFPPNFPKICFSLFNIFLFNLKSDMLEDLCYFSTVILINLRQFGGN